jgi:hypothetical protein
MPRNALFEGVSRSGVREAFFRAAGGIPLLRTRAVLLLRFGEPCEPSILFSSSAMLGILTDGAQAYNVGIDKGGFMPRYKNMQTLSTCDKERGFEMIAFQASDFMRLHL